MAGKSGVVRTCGLGYDLFSGGRNDEKPRCDSADVGLGRGGSVEPWGGFVSGWVLKCRQ